MGILDKIADVIGGALGIVDDLHTSDEERLTLKSSLLAIQAQVISEVIKAQSMMAQMQAQIITAEAKSGHWLTSAWRPITMLTFLVLIVLAQMGITQTVPDEMWPLLKIGLGGYVIGRSFEKTVPSVIESLKSKEDA
jgi:roadblock/LC7 domain-containing protein